VSVLSSSSWTGRGPRRPHQVPWVPHAARAARQLAGVAASRRDTLLRLWFRLRSWGRRGARAPRMVTAWAPVTMVFFRAPERSFESRGGPERLFPQPVGFPGHGPEPVRMVADSRNGDLTHSGTVARVHDPPVPALRSVALRFHPVPPGAPAQAATAPEQAGVPMARGPAGAFTHRLALSAPTRRRERLDGADPTSSGDSLLRRGMPSPPRSPSPMKLRPTSPGIKRSARSHPPSAETKPDPSPIERLIQTTVSPVALPGFEIRPVPATPGAAEPTDADFVSPGPTETNQVVSSSLTASTPELDLDRVADRVSQLLSRRRQIERERRGLY